MVAEIDVALPGCQGFQAGGVGGQHHLQSLPAFLQRGEGELAPHPVQDDAAGDADDLAGRGVGRQVRETGPQLRQRGGPGVTDGIGVDALRANPIELLAADPDLLRQVLELLGHVREAIGASSPQASGAR